MKTYPLTKSLPLGQTVITARALDRLHPADVCEALQRHARGDWGDLSETDQAENELSLPQGLRLLSAYHDRKGTKFWIITEPDHSSTVVALAEDY